MIDIWAWILIYLRFLDGWTYFILSRKIKAIKIANGHSRHACNLHILIDSFMVFYFLFHTRDLYMASAMIINTLFVLYYWWIVYQFYPYRRRGLVSFRKPSVIKYFINSLQPNNTRRHL